MNTMLLRAISFAMLVTATGVRAANPAASLADSIDAPINQQLAEAGIPAAEPLDDAAWLRRVTLDLAGRIPTTEEAAGFAAHEAADKRQQAVDRLLDSPDFAFHLRNELDILLLARKTHNDAWRKYLLEACRENRPWDVVFRELMLPEYERPEETGPAAFIRERVQDLDDLTNDTSSLLLGVNIGCAKCHDHPLVPDWEQQHYFGMARFFKHTYRTRTGFLGERPDAELKFTDISGAVKPAEFMFLTGIKVDPPPQKLSDTERKAIDDLIRKAEGEEGAPRPPLPEFSPRKEFVQLALHASATNLFAVNIVNRTWARLMGRGLVHPLDQIHSENPASHPELLDTLTADFVHTGYNLKRLIRSLVLSKVYARSSRWNAEQQRPAPELYAVAVPRPLTPRQLSLALIIASSDPARLPGLDKPADWNERREQWELQADGLARRLEIPDDGFQVAADEALFFSNASQFENDFLRDSGDRLIGSLKTVEDAQRAISIAFAATLTRQPSEVERNAIGEYLAARQDRPVEALRQVVWTLLASPEFRFNH